MHLDVLDHATHAHLLSPAELSSIFVIAGNHTQDYGVASADFVKQFATETLVCFRPVQI